MDEKTKKRFTKEFSMIESKNSLIKEPISLNDSCGSLGIGLPDIYKIMEKERYSLPKLEDIDKRINFLKNQENIDQDLIFTLEEMKMASISQNSSENTLLKDKGFRSIHDIVTDEHNNMVNGIQMDLSNEIIQLIKKQMKLEPGLFRSKYPELLDYISSLEE